MQTAMHNAVDVAKHDSGNEKEPNLVGQYARTNMGWPSVSTDAWRFRILPEPILSQTLERAAQPRSDANGLVHSVIFQPSPDPDFPCEDRRYADQWPLPNGLWTCLAVFDGHVGSQLADLAVIEIPQRLRCSVEVAFSRVPRKEEGQQPGVKEISRILASTLKEFDDDIGRDLLQLFPNGQISLSELSAADIRRLINDHSTGGGNHAKAMRSICGTTALIGLIDPSKENLWIANLGDCQATLGKLTEEGEWKGVLLTQNHNAANFDERRRVRAEHPGEPYCVRNGRVLGAITVTRALGDFAFKLPSDFIRKVVLNIETGFQTQRHTEELISRIHSPPYISNKAEVYHRTIKPSDKYLILSSDGLSDLYPQDPYACTDWVQSIATNESLEKNKALRVLRNALGGSEEDVVSRHLTVEMEGRWMDDTTILVLDLWGSGRDAWEDD